MRILLPLAASLALAAHAQTSDIPPEVKKMVEDIASTNGLKPLGGTFLSQLEDGDNEVIEVQVDPNKLTYIVVNGDDNVVGLRILIKTGSGDLVTSTGRPSAANTLEVAAGNGKIVMVQVDMECEDITCGYFAQAYVP